MARSVPPLDAVTGDDLDALFDMDMEAMEELLNDTNDSSNNTRSPMREQSTAARVSEGLGLDEEVKIAKKRQPVAKLDETRLLSDPGIPKLQRISKDRLKFRGKGREFSDISLLLRTYQLWLDDLYPRAKFADGLAIIEKLGHSKRMQVMRKAWLDEGKPKASYEDEDAELESLPLTVNPGTVKDTQFTSANGSLPELGNPDDDLSLMPRTEALRPSASSPLDENGGAPDEDELDALLGEDSLQDIAQKGNNEVHKPHQPGLRSHPTPPELSFEDDEEAMRDMDLPW